MKVCRRSVRVTLHWQKKPLLQLQQGCKWSLYTSEAEAIHQTLHNKQRAGRDKKDWERGREDGGTDCGRKYSVRTKTLHVNTRGSGTWRCYPLTFQSCWCSRFDVQSFWLSLSLSCLPTLPSCAGSPVVLAAAVRHTTFPFCCFWWNTCVILAAHCSCLCEAQITETEGDTGLLSELS